MKVFNAKNAAEDYMSMHTLTYSTPEMTLLKFARWLGEIVEMECKLDNCINDDGLHPRHKVPRLMLYIEEKEDYKMDISEEFVPSGAVTTLFAKVKAYPMGSSSNEIKSRQELRFCIACGAKIEADASFCIECGAKQE